MARTPRNLIELLDQLFPDVAKAYRQSLINITKDIKINDLIAALQLGDIPAAMTALGLSDPYYAPLGRALRDSHLNAGEWTLNRVKAMGSRAGVSVVGAFDSENVRAARILRENSATRIVGLAESNRQAVREILAGSMEAGRSPRQTARDLVGRTMPGGGRTGGTIGLGEQRARWVNGGYKTDSQGVRVYQRGMRDELQDLDSSYFNRKGRDRRFDPTVRTAIRTGRPLTATQIRKMTDRYSDRLLGQRAEVIARTELLGSIHAAQDEGLRQLVDSGQINEQAIKSKWDAANDAATRDTHAAADGQVRRQGEAFIIGGHQMMFPGDRSLGAPIEEIAQCRCIKRVDIDFMFDLRSRL